MQRRHFIFGIAGGAALLAPYSHAAVSAQSGAAQARVRAVGLRDLATQRLVPGSAFDWQGVRVAVERGAYRFGAVTNGAVPTNHPAVEYPVFDAAPIAEGSILVSPLSGGVRLVDSRGRSEWAAHPNSPHASVTRLAADGSAWMAWDQTNHLLRLASGAWMDAQELNLHSVQEIAALGHDRWAIVDRASSSVLLIAGDSTRRFGLISEGAPAVSLTHIVSVTGTEIVVAGAASVDIECELQELV